MPTLTWKNVLVVWVHYILIIRGLKWKQRQRYESVMIKQNPVLLMAGLDEKSLIKRQ